MKDIIDIINGVIWSNALIFFVFGRRGLFFFCNKVCPNLLLPGNDPLAL